MNKTFESVLKKGMAATGIRLSEEQIRLLVLHAHQLMLWNRKINLTAIRNPDQIAEKHFIDCMAAFRFLPGAGHVMDIGSGGGFPGIVYKIVCPDTHVVLVDASRKKVNFLMHVIRTAGLENIEALHTRIEDLHTNPRYAGQFDLIFSRAFAELEKFEMLAVPLLARSGTICAMKGRSVAGEISQGLREHYRIQNEHYRLPFEQSDRHVVLMQPVNPAAPTGDINPSSA